MALLSLRPDVVRKDPLEHGLHKLLKPYHLANDPCHWSLDNPPVVAKIGVSLLEENSRIVDALFVIAEIGIRDLGFDLGEIGIQ